MPQYCLLVWFPPTIGRIFHCRYFSYHSMMLWRVLLCYGTSAWSSSNAYRCFRYSLSSLPFDVILLMLFWMLRVSLKIVAFTFILHSPSFLLMYILWVVEFRVEIFVHCEESPSFHRNLHVFFCSSYYAICLRNAWQVIHIYGMEIVFPTDLAYVGVILTSLSRLLCDCGVAKH